MPVSAGELFASGAEEVQLPIENEEDAFDVPIAEDEFNITEETFTADDSEDKFQDAEEDVTGDTDEIRYIKGRPLTAVSYTHLDVYKRQVLNTGM